MFVNEPGELCTTETSEPKPIKLDQPVENGVYLFRQKKGTSKPDASMPSLTIVFQPHSPGEMVPLVNGNLGSQNLPNHTMVTTMFTTSVIIEMLPVRLTRM